MNECRVAVYGALGLVGTQLLSILEEREFPVSELHLFTSARSAGAEVRFAGRQVPVLEADEDAIPHIDLAFLAVGDAISARLAPKLAARGATVIDKSNAFRMDPHVPLVVPEVNGESAATHEGIIANPNCSTIQLVMALSPLHEAAGLREVTVATYQSVSGSGAEALEELAGEVEGRSDPHVYPKPIAFNVLPQCDRFLPDGSTREETKLVNETRKILDLPNLPIAATAARVPVRVGHSEAVWAGFDGEMDANMARSVLENMQGLALADDPEALVYPTPLGAEGRDEVFVGRLRDDPIRKNGISLWVVADNLRKGAALNAVQIAEMLLAADAMRREPVSRTTQP